MPINRWSNIKAEPRTLTVTGGSNLPTQTQSLNPPPEPPFAAAGNMSLKSSPRRRRRVSVASLLVLIAVSTIFGLLMADLRSIDPSPELQIRNSKLEIFGKEELSANTTVSELGKKCATVEEMGEIFSRGYAEESLRVRGIIRNHFAVNGALLLLDFTFFFLFVSVCI